MASPSTKRQKMPKGKGKNGRNDEEVPMIPLQRREGVLDYSRISKRNVKWLHLRKIFMEDQSYLQKF